MTAKRATVAISHRQTIPGLPGHYTHEAVAVVKEMLKEVTDHLGGMRKFVKPGDNVIIKPNLAFPVGPDDGATTDPRALEALIELIRDEVPGVGEIVVGEGSACLGWIEGLTGEDVFSATGMTTLAERAGVRLIDWEEDERVPVQVEGAVVLPDFEVPRSLHEADVFINLPKL
ncbi:MAG: DUF362 domain-containing protein, partial [Chloroflexota bacterium]|nr:DUF362 domain-containing protein [Chloroflexota bacterium]